MPTRDSWTAAGMSPCDRTVRKRFGSFRAAMERLDAWGQPGIDETTGCRSSHLYGNPIAGDASRTPVLGIIAVFLAGFAAALALMRRRDISTA
jgi:hypothetical protein